MKKALIALFNHCFNNGITIVESKEGNGFNIFNGKQVTNTDKLIALADKCGMRVLPSSFGNEPKRTLVDNEVVEEHQGFYVGYIQNKLEIKSADDFANKFLQKNQSEQIQSYHLCIFYMWRWLFFYIM